MYDKLKTFYYSYVPLTPEEWEDKIQYLTVRKVKKNEFIVQPGQICRSVHFINEGVFRTYNLIGDKEITTNFFFDCGYVTDYASYINQIPAREYIQALTDGELLSFPHEKMQEMYEKYPRAQKYGRLIAEKIFVNTYSRQQEFLFLNPKERYLKLLKKRPKVVQRIPQHYIASYLGITPEYLSRIRKELTQTLIS